MSSDLSINEIKAFFERNYLKNRAAVCLDIEQIFDDIERVTGLKVKRHCFPSGREYGTWIVPPSWDVKEAWIKGPDGKIIASYQEHPLFVSPYSRPVHEKLSREELLKHVFFEPKQPDAFAYNWRYICDYNLRMKEWGISLPKARVDALARGEYEIFIDVDSHPSKMLVGEIVVPGREKNSLTFLANYCHTGQVNDSFSGLGMFMKVLHDLAQKPRPRYTYRLLVIQETIGSAVFISRYKKQLQRELIGAIFSEMVAWGDEWFIKQSRTGKSYVDAMARSCVAAYPDVKIAPFFSVYGNDEFMFDSVHVGIPSISIQKHPFKEYHTSHDNMSHVREEDLQRACDMTMSMVDILEQDRVYAFTGPVPFWMTRFKLFSDDVAEKDDFLFKFDIVYKLLDGKRSVLDMANALGAPFAKVNSFVQAMRQNGLVKVVGERPWQSYSRRSLSL